MKQLIPKGLYFHRFQDHKDNSYLNVFYLSMSSNKSSHEELINNEADFVGYIQFYTYDDTDEAIITSLNINERFRGKGYAYYLLYKTVEYLDSVDVYSITLDDDSDAFRKSGNIYLKFGFRYLSDYGPEMLGLVDELYDQKHVDYLLKKYKDIYTF